MEPRIQYARTSDGVNIAFFVIGVGPPLVVGPPTPWTHLAMEWKDPAYRAWDERLARSFRVIRFDSRGSGLSDRDPPDGSVEAQTADLAAIAAKLGLERFALLSPAGGASTAVAYAALNPERVTDLVLWCPYSRDDFSDRDRALLNLAKSDWSLFLETGAHATAASYTGGEDTVRFAELMREAYSRESFLKHLVRQSSARDAEYRAAVHCRTLIVHRRDARRPTAEAIRTIAATIPASELVLVEGAATFPYIGDFEAVARVVYQFLGAPATHPGPAVEAANAPGALQTILFTDVEGSTALTDRLGDAAARDVLREHERITREALKAHGGSEVKTMGDGFMASFGSATKALECAVAIQKAFAVPDTDVGAQHTPKTDVASATTGPASTDDGTESTRAAPLRPGAAIRVRIGLNAGEPIAEDDPGGRSDLFGTAVIVAARIAAQAQGGEILVSDVVRQLVAGKGFLFSDRGEHALKGFEDPVRVWEVRWSA
jgi:class 3 adenylate cyclase/pimeloyl-ACP methyl ester carboxylesterase